MRFEAQDMDMLPAAEKFVQGKGTREKSPIGISVKGPGSRTRNYSGVFGGLNVYPMP
jgi:hypothetical protein